MQAFVENQESLIEIRGLSVRYGEVRALDALDLEVGPGATGLLGPNGAGKTTLIKVLLGHLAPPGGTVRILGRDPRDRRERMEVRRGVGYMPENDCLMAGMNGLEIVAVLGRLSGLGRDDAMARAHEALDYVGLEEERYRVATGYSTGMKQRLKLAQALVHDPGLLLLDEPTNGLDPRARVQVLELIDDLARNHKKHVLLCSHLLPDVERLCQDVVVLDRGRRVTSGPIEELTAGGGRWFRMQVAGGGEAFFRGLEAADIACEPAAEGRLRVKLPDGAPDADQLLAIAAASGTAIESIEPLRATLEDVFLRVLEKSGAHRS